MSFIAQGLGQLIVEQGLISASTILTIFDAACTLGHKSIQQACLDFFKGKELLAALHEIVIADGNAGRERELGLLAKALAAPRAP